MVKRIRRAAVLGSGVMGLGIAAHLANVGIPTLLLDIVPRELTKEEEAKGWTLEHKQVRNRLANQALERLLKQKPAPLMSKDNIALIETGNFEDDFHRLAEVDWIIEAVVEKLEVKKKSSLASTRCGRRGRSSARTHPASRSPQWRRGVPTISKNTF